MTSSFLGGTARSYFGFAGRYAGISFTHHCHSAGGPAQKRSRATMVPLWDVRKRTLTLCRPEWGSLGSKLSRQRLCRLVALAFHAAGGRIKSCRETCFEQNARVHHAVGAGGAWCASLGSQAALFRDSAGEIAG